MSGSSGAALNLSPMVVGGHLNYGKEWKFIDWLVADLSNVRAYCQACRCFGEYVSKYGAQKNDCETLARGLWFRRPDLTNYDHNRFHGQGRDQGSKNSYT